MKTAKKCLLSLVLLTLGFSCTESELTIEPPNYKTRTLNLVTDEVSIANQVRVLENGAELYLEGEVSSCNLSQSTTFSLNGRIIKTNNEGAFIIRDGEFMLQAAPTGCNLRGRLEGEGNLEANHFVIKANVKSLCGNGVFDCDGGELLLTIKGDNAGNQDNHMTFSLEVSGSLHKRS